MTAQPFWTTAAGWTSARVELLVRHYSLGLTCAESADALGGVSRNAVLCKRLRLGLTAQSRDVGGALAGLLSGRRFQAPEPPPLPCHPLPRMDESLPHGARPKPLVDRQPRECAWPLGAASRPGDYRTLFCCAPTLRRRPYCQAHLAIARREP